MEYVGICTCGHHDYNHHGNVIMRTDAPLFKEQPFRNVAGVLYGGCEYPSKYEPECKCYGYWDQSWPPREKKEVNHEAV